MFAQRVSHTELFFKYHLYDWERLYCRAIAPLGLRRVRVLMQQGFPPQLREPLESRFTNNLDAGDRQNIARVERLRENMAQMSQIFEPVESNRTSGLDGYALAYRASVPPQWGKFLYCCAKSFSAKRILELGSGGGISGAYFASAPGCQEFVSIEGGPERAAISASNLAQIGSHARVIHGMFQDVVPDVVKTSPGYDLMNLDGSHNFDATVHWIKAVMPALGHPALVLLDDIHWSKGMYDAWQHIVNTFGFAFALDVGRFGVCYWTGSPTTTRLENLARWVGWFRSY